MAEEQRGIPEEMMDAEDEQAGIEGELATAAGTGDESMFRGFGSSGSHYRISVHRFGGHMVRGVLRDLPMPGPREHGKLFAMGNELPIWNDEGKSEISWPWSNLPDPQLWPFIELIT